VTCVRDDVAIDGVPAGIGPLHGQTAMDAAPPPRRELDGDIGRLADEGERPMVLAGVGARNLVHGAGQDSGAGERRPAK